MPAIKGRRQPRGELRRAAILDAAAQLMSSRGYRGTSLAAVAEAVGVSEAGVLHHFGSKEELLVALLEERHRVDRPAIASWADVGGLPALRDLRNIAASIVADPSVARLMTVLSAEHLDDDGPVNRWFAERARNVREGLATILRGGIGRGEIDSRLDVTRKAAEIMAFMDGIQAQWFLDPAAFDLVEAYDSFITDLIAVVATAEVGVGG